jgi:hypothetical protein
MTEFRFGDAMRKWWQLSTTRYGASLLVSLAIFIPLIVIIAGVMFWLFGSGTTMPEAEIIATLKKFFSSGTGILVGLLAVIFVLLLTSWMASAHSLLAQGEMTGRPLTALEALAQGFGRILPVIGASLIFFAVLFLSILPGIIIGGMIAAIGGGVTGIVVGSLVGLMGLAIAISIFVIAPVAAAVENSGPLQAMRRSSALVADNKLKVFGFYLAVLLLTTLASEIPEAMIGIANKSAGSLVGLVLTLLLLPFSNFVVPALFFAVREAREGKPAEQLAHVFA